MALTILYVNTDRDTRIMIRFASMRDLRLYDRVASTDDGEPGTVIELDELGVVVQFDNGIETWLEYEQVELIEYE